MTDRCPRGPQAAPRPRPRRRRWLLQQAGAGALACALPPALRGAPDEVAPQWAFVPPAPGAAAARAGAAGPAGAGGRAGTGDPSARGAGRADASARGAGRADASARGARTASGRVGDVSADAVGAPAGAEPAHPAATGAAGDAAEAAPPWQGDGLPPGWAAALARCGVPASALGLWVQPLRGGMVERLGGGVAPLAHWQAERPMQLASTAKLVTALAAVSLLGPGFRWHTAATLHGALGADGALDGDLEITGGGNAFLRSADLLAWFSQMRAAGLAEVRGHLRLNRDAFQLLPEDFARTPPPLPSQPHHAWPAALVLDATGRGAGGAGGTGLWTVAAAVTGSGAAVGMAGSTGATGGAAGLPHAVAPAAAGRRAARGPATHAGGTAGLTGLAGQVATLWQQAGLGLAGQVREQGGGWPARPWQLHHSAALPQLLRDMLKPSDNLAARHLMLSMSPGFPQRPATLAAAQARVAQWLQRQGLGAGAIRVDSGSGLSREERGSARALGRLLARAWHDPAARPVLDGLPVAGVDGTLAQRLQRGPATGRAFLKTGSLLDTRALAGYVLGASGTPHVFVALVNHADAARAVPALDQFVEWVAARA